MGHLLGVLDQKKLDLQRGVVQNEKRQGENQPYGVTEQFIVENTYPVGHPYSWTVIGSMKDLDAASLSDVQEWFKTYYGPNNVTVVIAGDITPEVAREKVEKYYGEIPAGPAHRQAGSVDCEAHRHASRLGAGPRSASAPVSHMECAGIRIARRSAAGFGGAGSRPGQNLAPLQAPGLQRSDRDQCDRVEQRRTRSADSSISPSPRLRVETCSKVEKAADEELQNFLKNGPTAAELQLAKTQILGTYARIVERIGGFGGKSDLLARCQTFPRQSRLL